jgi:acyl-CoA thioesterase-1
MALLAVVVLTMMPVGRVAKAATYSIVALGASNTNGLGVSSDQAFPAQIQAMLRAKGIDAQLSVAATNGMNSSGLLGTADSISAGTNLVLVEPVKDNDRKTGIGSSNSANLAQIQSKLRARGIKSIVIRLRPLPPGGLQGDGVHLTPAGHRAIAARYLPQVMAALRSR